MTDLKPAQTTTPNRLFASISGMLRNRSTSTAPVWLVLLAVLAPVAIFLPGFFASNNLENALVQMVPLGIITIGQMFVILGGGIDLSVGPLVSLITVVMSRLMTDDPSSIVLAALVGLAIGLLGGFLSGLILSYFDIPPLIVTLAMGYMYLGAALAFNLTSGGTITPLFASALTGDLVGILTVPLLAFLMIFAVSVYVLNFSQYGRWLYALGGEEDVLASTGVNTNRVRIASYMYCGLLCAIAAMFVAARLRSGNAYYGDEFTLLSVAAVVVGGAPLAGGRGKILGSLAGIILVSVFNNVLNILGFKFQLQSAFYKSIVIGVVLLVAMLAYGRMNDAHES